jgi:pyruvate dehydrogenase E2 component (dihydrolipoamide acetyltransferase)
MMATDVILPALGMSQETGKIVQWLKAEGEQVAKGEPLAEIETDKATVEIEAPADGVLAHVAFTAGDDVPVGQVIAAILAVEEAPEPQSERAQGTRGDHLHPRAATRAPTLPNSTPAPTDMMGQQSGRGQQDARGQQGAMERQSVKGQQGAMERQGEMGQRSVRGQQDEMGQQGVRGQRGAINRAQTGASPLASRIAAEHNLDLSQVKSAGKRIQKADVLAYLQNQDKAAPTKATARLMMASPKARRLAAEQGKDLAVITGTGPGGAVLAADVLAATVQAPPATEEVAEVIAATETSAATANELTLGNTWRIMAQRTTQSWTSVPHFYLVREVNASRLITWREHILKRSAEKVTYTDLLVKIAAAALRMHPRLNVSWSEGNITLKQEVHIGLAVAIEEGLVVPVIHRADTLSLGEIARQRMELTAKAPAGKLRPQDISDGTFTISNLGMYNVDAFNAIINQPQAAILAVGRISERVVPVHSQPAVQPMMVLTLSCDHRAVDGARGAQFLDTIATLIEEPLGLLG